MSLNKTSYGYSEYLFRPIYELQTSAVWAGAALLSPVTGFVSAQSNWGVTLMVSAACAVGAGFYAIKALPLIQKQMAAQRNTKLFLKSSELRRRNHLDKRATQPNFKDPKTNFIGYGFEWGAEHARRAYQIMNLDSDMSKFNLPWPLSYVSKKDTTETRELGGKTFIHAIGTDKQIHVAEDNWFGHTIITGNVGTGKTTLLKLLSLNALHMNVGNRRKIVIIIDPKNDTDWRAALRSEMSYLGMEEHFYFLHPAKQSESVRIPLLKNYSRITEIADRVAPLMGTSGGSKTFEDFAAEQITFVAAGLKLLGEPIRLTTLRNVLGGDKSMFAERVLRKYFERLHGEEWEAAIGLTVEKSKNPSLNVMSYLNYRYEKIDSLKYPDQAVAGVLQLYHHPEEHFVKMITSLRPVLTALTAAPMDDLFSPVYDADDEDPREIVDIEKMMETGGVLYVSLDSLTDSRTAGFIARLLSAEIASVAGRRYNQDDASAPRVCLFIDEAHATLENNEAILSLKAQGRAAGIEVTLSTQTLSDIEAKTNEATAKRILGLANNFISMRSSDPATQEYAAEQFGQTYINQIQVQRASGISTDNSFLDFNSTEGARSQQTMEDAFPKQLLGDLPKLQYIARLADGRKLKMKLPIIINDTQGKVATWL